MKKNGFTLIELLAVIIILAVIALIATPIVLNVVDNAKKSAAESSVAGYADAIKLAQYDYLFAHDGAYPTAFSDLGTVTVGGEKPVGCTETLNADHTITLTGCKVESYSSTKTFKYENGKVTEETA